MSETNDVADVIRDATSEIPSSDKEGAFIKSLKRNLPKIRADRAQSLIEDAELTYKRTIEDLQVEMRKLIRDRENMLDLSPDNALSIKIPTDFNSKEFTSKDIEIGIRLRNLEIKLEVAKARYTYLFGELNG